VHTPPLLGIDIGGTGIKGAPVDLDAGCLLTERLKIPTPHPAEPEAILEVVAKICDEFADIVGDSPVGVTVPAVVTRGVVKTAANLDHSWIGTDASSLFVGRLMRPVVLLNDADAAGIAELSYGAVRGVPGVVLVVTLGTGIGTALFINGSLVPNTEIGHLVLDGDDMCFTACAAARANEQLSWQVWAARLEKYLRYAEDLLWPDLIVIGGGVSRKADRFLPYLHIRTPITTAQLQNEAGIIGAALAAGHG
jgi:polyphosphate glucokinase